MDTCPYCSHNLLSHLRNHSRYWYCTRCRCETSENFITAKNQVALNHSLRLSPHRSSVVAAQLAI